MIRPALKSRGQAGSTHRSGVAIAALLTLSGLAFGQAPADPRLPPPLPAGTLPDAPKVNPSLAPFENRPVREVKISGLKTITDQFVRNQIRAVEGTALREIVVQGDVQRITRTGKFERVDARVTPFADGSVLLEFVVLETPVVRAARAVGNRQITDDELKEEIDVFEGTPVDRYRIDQMLRRIKDLYKKKGYYQADVSIDEGELRDRGNLLFQIREGDRLKVTDIRFDGNKDFTESQLRTNVKTETWGIFSPGALDDAILDEDVAKMIAFYKDRGRLDIRIDRQIRPSPDGKEAILTFIIDEGQVYTLRSVRVQTPGTDEALVAQGKGPPPIVFTREQLAALMRIKSGDVYSADKITKSVDIVRDAYGKLGYVDVRVQRQELRDTTKPEVDLLLTVYEGSRFMTGDVVIKGNDLTQDRVIRRDIRVAPDRPLDTTEVKNSEQAMQERNLFDNGEHPPRFTIQPEDPQNPGYRNVLMEIRETNTGKLGFGAAVNSNLGLIGQIEFTQRNFDIHDTPDSWSELFTGRAFRGAGQTFSIVLQPGTTYQNYAVSIAEPYLFESQYGGSIGAGYNQQTFDEYTDGRIYFNASIARRFGERWTGDVSLRLESINLSDIRQGATQDLLAVQGSNTLAGVAARVRRSDLDRMIRPTKGTTFVAGVERVGGDFSYTRINAALQGYLPLYEDFYGHKTILSMRTGIAFSPEKQADVPLFERFYGGGSDIRGFSYRGVSPRGIIAGTNLVGSDPVGGIWSVTAGVQVEQPLWQETLSVVAFMDTGTVNESHYNLSKFRASVGMGLRIYVPQLGPAPLAFDFAFPIKREDFDVKRVFSFSIDLPF